MPHTHLDLGTLKFSGSQSAIPMLPRTARPKSVGPRSASLGPWQRLQSNRWAAGRDGPQPAKIVKPEMALKAQPKNFVRYVALYCNGIPPFPPRIQPPQRAAPSGGKLPRPQARPASRPPQAASPRGHARAHAGAPRTSAGCGERLAIPDHDESSTSLYRVRKPYSFIHERQIMMLVRRWVP
jgi:hypothetical protein